MIDYVKTFVVYLISLVVHKKYKDFWLIGERGTDARDNAYWMFRYISENYPQEKILYLIDDESADYDKVSIIGNTIKPNSLRHGIVYLSCSTIVCTHANLCRPKWKGMYFAINHKVFNKNEKRIFLDHGIVKDYLPEFTYPSLKVDLFTAGAKPEFDYITANFKHKEGVVQYTGLARFDNLYRNIINKIDSSNRFILYMPTWRVYLSNCSKKEEFMKSEFYTKMDALLKDSRLIKMLEENNYRLVFYPHYEVQKWLTCFNSISEKVIIASFKDYDVQKLLISCSALITDYSSVFFDVAYMNKPIFYYQFDQDIYRKTQYQEGYLSYENAFGPLTDNLDSLVNEIKKYFEGTYLEKYMQKEIEFFPLKDDKCCERIYKLIVSIKKS